jgi:hypothetical protein
MKPSTHSKPHVVYRCYDVEDRLIYVGMTSLAWANRFRTHQHRNPRVAEQTRRVTFEQHPDRPSAARAESIAIDTEAPLLNVRRGADYDPDFAELAAAVSALPSLGGAA